MATLGSLVVKLGLDPSQFRNGLIKSRADLAAYKRSIEDSDSSTTKWAKRLDSLGDKLRSSGAAAARMGIQAGAVASAAITMAPALVATIKWIGQVGGATLAVTPMLFAFGAAFGIVKTTITRNSQEMMRGFNPFMEALGKSEVATSHLMAKGVEPLTAAFTKMNMPAISAGMNSIAESTNRVVVRFLTWGKSTAGVQAIKNLMTGTADAAALLSPRISRLVGSFGNMIGRIAEVSLSAGASGLGGVLDRLSVMMDKVNAASVLVGLNSLKAKYDEVKGAIERVIRVVKELYTAFQNNREAIGRVQDGIAILALATGPLGAIVAVVSLLYRHWDDIKNVVGPFIGPFVAAISNMAAQFSPLVPVLAQIAASFLQWGTVAATILTPVINLLVSLIVPLAPMLSFLLPPILAIIAAKKAWAVAQGLLNIALLANPIGIVIGLIIGLVAIIVYAWQNCQTFRDIVLGVFGAIHSFISDRVIGIRILLAWFGTLPDRFREWFGGMFISAVVGFNNLVSLAAGIGGRILGAVGNLGSLLYDAGANVVRGLIDGIESMLGAVASAASSVASTIRSYLPFSPAKTGPLSGTGSPDLAGGKIAAMLASGMFKQLPYVEGMAGRLAAAASPSGYSGTAGAMLSTPMPSGLARATGSGAPELKLSSDGSKLGDLLLEVVEKAARGQGLTVVSAR